MRILVALVIVAPRVDVDYSPLVSPTLADRSPFPQGLQSAARAAEASGPTPPATGARCSRRPPRLFAANAGWATCRWTRWRPRPASARGRSSAGSATSPGSRWPCSTSSSANCSARARGPATARARRGAVRHGLRPSSAPTSTTARRNLELVRLSETASPGARYRIGSYRFWHRHVAVLLAQAGMAPAWTPARRARRARAAGRRSAARAWAPRPGPAPARRAGAGRCRRQHGHSPEQPPSGSRECSWERPERARGPHDEQRTGPPGAPRGRARRAVA